MTREERSRANAQLKKKRARATILGFIQDNSSANEYKKRDGTWNVTRLSKATKLSRPTIILHLKELREEGLI
jgi:DNA-binding transcriptional ArsR family regulator